VKLSEVIEEYACRTNPIRHHNAVVVVELAISNTYPNSYVMQDFLRGLVRSSAQGMTTSELDMYGSAPKEAWSLFVEELENSLKLWHDVLTLAAKHGA
jgi:hypothetical protein